jgi:hypothetical protein
MFLVVRFGEIGIGSSALPEVGMKPLVIKTLRITILAATIN